MSAQTSFRTYVGRVFSVRSKYDALLAGACVMQCVVLGGAALVLYEHGGLLMNLLASALLWLMFVQVAFFISVRLYYILWWEQLEETAKLLSANGSLMAKINALEAEIVDLQILANPSRRRRPQP